MPKGKTPISTVVFSSIISAVLSLTLLLFLPVTQDFYSLNKLYFLAFGAIIVLVIWAIDSYRTQKIHVTPSPAALGFGAITMASIISLILASPNKIEALLSPYGVIPVASMTVFLFFGSHWFDAAARKRTAWIFLSAATFLSTIAVYQYLDFGKRVFPGITYLQDPLWSPAGSPTSLLSILLLGIPVVIYLLLEAYKHRDSIALGFGSIIFLILVAGSTLTLYQFLPRIPTAFLSYADGWRITFEALKSPLHALFGVGVENFLSAFTQGKQASYNLTPLWNVRFATNSTYLFHVIATMGLIGGAAIFLLAKALVPKKLDIYSAISLTALLFILLLPPMIVGVVLTGLVFLIIPDKSSSVTLSLPPTVKWLHIAIMIFAVVFAAGSGWGLYRAHAAERLFYSSLLPDTQADGTRVYELQLRTTQLNPQITRFHARFSVTSIALANAIVAQARKDAEELGLEQTLDDNERQVVTQLIQQAIRQAKAATTLAPENVTAWENLGAIYQALIGVAEGADRWAVAALQQAAALDPSNPMIRMNLGGIYMRQQDYENAKTQFAAASQLKPDLANAYYNLANVYKLQNDFPRAIIALEEVLKYVGPDTSDFAKATNDLTQLRASQDEPQGAIRPTLLDSQELPTETLDTISPEATTASDISPPLELNDDFGTLLDESEDATAASELDL